jgi:protein-tyrosine-phosphatase
LNASSASTLGLHDHPAHKHAVKVMSELGVDISKHQSQPVTDALVSNADHILVMEIMHAAKLRERHPMTGEKIMLLGTFGGLIEIGDPLGGWRGRFRKSRDEIRDCVETFIDRLPQR